METRNNKEYKNILKNIDELIIAENKKEINSENLLKAINYYMNIREKGQLYTFLENGEMEIDNNIAERIENLLPWNEEIQNKFCLANLKLIKNPKSGGMPEVLFLSNLLLF